MWNLYMLAGASPVQLRGLPHGAGPHGSPTGNSAGATLADSSKAGRWVGGGRFAGVEHCFIMGEVTFGACCVDDYSALALRTDFLIHYGHSCLVPVDVTGLPCLYVFVDIHVDVPHLLATIRCGRPAAHPPLPYGLR